ncbi:MAG: neutral ceramidase [Verrucomicrobiales bacterium]
MNPRSFSFLFVLIGIFTASAAAEFRAGAAKADITPELGVLLDGTISQNGPATKIHDRLYARCLVLDDGEAKLAFAIVDNTMISGSIIDEAKRLIEEQTGIPGSNVIIAATHSHSTPRAVVGLVDDQSHRDYLDSLAVSIASGVRSAVERLEPAEIGWGSGEEARYVHCRRWLVEGAEKQPNPFGETGERVRMNPGRTGLIKPAGPVDPEVFICSVRNAKGEPLALLANYGLHYVGGTGRGQISADYFGAFAVRIQQLLGAEDTFVGIMSNGTSGDVNANDLTQPRQKSEPYERIELIAGHLADEAKRVYESIEHSREVRLGAVETVLELEVRKPDADRLAWARETAAPPNAKLRLTRPQVYAREAVALADFPKTAEVRIQAFRIGELAVTAIPNEVFAETGLAIKSGSPFSATFAIELANGYHGYLPTPEQHKLGGYETWPARSAYLETEAESKIRAAALELLKQLRD